MRLGCSRVHSPSLPVAAKQLPADAKPPSVPPARPKTPNAVSQRPTPRPRAHARSPLPAHWRRGAPPRPCPALGRKDGSGDSTCNRLRPNKDPAGAILPVFPKATLGSNPQGPRWLLVNPRNPQECSPAWDAGWRTRMEQMTKLVSSSASTSTFTGVAVPPTENWEER